jgi:predicted Fe-Mo cluster-binding NifX family protein
MEIVIPTNDGSTIATDFEQASSYRFVTLTDGVVQKDVTEAIAPLTPDQKNQHLIMVRGISPESEKNLISMNYEIIHTQDPFIVNALFSYLKRFARMESNYCCCP